VSKLTQPLTFTIIQDTEFPGVVARPVGSFRTSGDYQYQTLRCNVDLLNIIQLGVTFADDQGNLPTDPDGKGPCTWQFNFKFSLE
jgi:CCR4-NOT transcription complex subunit 7/8